MMQLYTHHWHVAVTRPEHRDGCEDRSFEDVDSAVDYAGRRRDGLLRDGHTMTEVDRPDDDVSGVIQRYQDTEQGGHPAMVEVRPCHRAGCLPERSRERLGAVGETLPPELQDRPVQLLNAGGLGGPLQTVNRSVRVVAGPLG